MIEPDTPAHGDPPIRLSIGHLMAWTACSALFLAVYRLVDASAADGEFRAIRTVSHVFYSFMSGASVASLAVLVHRRVNGWKYPIFAGHWVLTVLGVTGLFYGVNFLLTHLIELLEDADMLAEPLRNGRINYAAYTLVSFAAAALFGSLLFVRIPLRWKVYAVLAALAAAIQTIAMLWLALLPSTSGAFDLMSLTAYLTIAKSIPLSICLIQDLRDRVSYDFLHWTGLGVAFMGVALTIYWQFAMWMT